MKHILSALLALVMTLTLAACGGGQTPATSHAAESGTGNTTAPSGKTGSDGADAPSGRKALVVYFSRTGEQYTVGVIEKGNTAIVAETIAEKTGADLWEVLPADDHYPMTYSALTDVAKREQSEKARPAYKGTAPDGSGLSGFDKKLGSAIPGAAVGKGLAVRGNDAQNNRGAARDSVNAWLDGLGF